MRLFFETKPGAAKIKINISRFFPFRRIFGRLQRKLTRVGIKNTGPETATFAYNIKVKNVTSKDITFKEVETWFLSAAGEEHTLNSGQTYKDVFSIKIPKNAPLARYMIGFTLDCIDCDLDTQENIIFEVI